MRYRDEFPEGCPPPEAVEIRERVVVYRLADGFPGRARDFKTMWQRQPGSQDLMGEKECQAKGLSVFTDLDDALTALRRRGSGYAISLELGAGTGVIQETPSRSARSHCTWWPAYGIDYAELEQRECGQVQRRRRGR